MQRFRQKGQILASTGGWQTVSTNYNSAGIIISGPTYGTVQPSLPTGELQTMYDVVTDGFRKRRAKGEFIFNPLRIERRSQSITGGPTKWELWTTTAPIYKQQTTDHLSNAFNRWIALMSNWDGTKLNVPDLLTLSEKENLVNEVATTCRARVRAGESEGIESLYQLRQTLELVRRPFSGLHDFLDSFNRKVRFHRKKGTVEAISAEYLKVRYGLMPLISDISNVMKALEKDYSSDLHTSRATGKLERQSTTSSTVSLASIIDCNLETVTTHKYSVRAMSADKYIASIATDLGLSLDQVPYAAYNLIPLSFVADWVINVGEFVNAVTPRLDLKHLGDCIVTVDEKQTIVQPTSTFPRSAAYRVITPVTGAYVQNTMLKVRGALPPAKLVIRSDFGFDRNTRVADAMALLYQQLVEFVRGEPPQTRNKPRNPRLARAR